MSKDSFARVFEIGPILYALAIVGLGIETIVCVYFVSHATAPHPGVIQVLPWVPSIPVLAYAIGILLGLCGVGLLFRRAVEVSSITLGALLIWCALFFDVPRGPNIMDAAWRTNVLESLALGSLAWIMPGNGAASRRWHTVNFYLLAFAFIVFGIAHFQVLPFVASLVPAWIPWHRFWALFFGDAFIAAGLSFATGYLRRKAAAASGLMFAIWVLTLHIPRAFGLYHVPGATRDPDEWSNVFIVLALWGGMWTLASKRPIRP